MKFTSVFKDEFNEYVKYKKSMDMIIPDMWLIFMVDLINILMIII